MKVYGWKKKDVVVTIEECCIILRNGVYYKQVVYTVGKLRFSTLVSPNTIIGKGSRSWYSELMGYCVFRFR